MDTKINSSKKSRILITCAGGSGPIYLAKKLSKKYDIFLADSNKDNVAPHLGFPFAIIPMGHEDKYLSEVSRLIEKNKIDCIVPGADEELIKVARLCEQKRKILSIIPSAEFIGVCLNKKRLMGVLLEENISDLSYFKEIIKVQYPAIVKPVYGRGSRGVYRIDNKSQLEGYLKLYQKKFEDIIAQPFIFGDEYTVSVIVNNLNKIIGIVSKKVIYKRGITRAAVTVENSFIEETCCSIVEKMNPQGPFNVQLIMNGGKIYIFEINPRLSTTSVLTDKAFGNEVDLYIKNYNISNIKKNNKIKQNIFLYRYEENIFN